LRPRAKVPTKERTRQVEEQLKRRIRSYLQDEMGDAVGSLAIEAANVAMPRVREPIMFEGF
jgi:hypothetical protein